jgi:hypothetical protein
MVVGCYSMDLYCDTPRHVYGGPSQFTGHTEGECLKEARSRGWKFNRAKTLALRSRGWKFNRAKTLAFCPECSKKEKK